MSSLGTQGGDREKISCCVMKNWAQYMKVNRAFIRLPSAGHDNPLDTDSKEAARLFLKKADCQNAKINMLSDEGDSN